MRDPTTMTTEEFIREDQLLRAAHDAADREDSWLFTHQLADDKPPRRRASRKTKQLKR